MMTPEQRIKRHIILEFVKYNDEYESWVKKQGELTADNVDEVYEEVDAGEGILGDTYNEFRESGEPTGLTTPFSRHYESTAVARQLSDGAWVGWTYWYGGGKHGCPEELGWMDDAYDVDVVEEEKMVVVKTFTKKE